jgi:hypothetical protein
LKNPLNYRKYCTFGLFKAEAAQKLPSLIAGFPPDRTPKGSDPVMHSQGRIFYFKNYQLESVPSMQVPSHFPLLKISKLVMLQNTITKVRKQNTINWKK